VLDALYGTEFNKNMASLIDGMNEAIKSQNRIQKTLYEMDEQLAKINGMSERHDRQLDELFKEEYDIGERLGRLKQSPYL
jgi:DNA repair ATPase RecN